MPNSEPGLDFVRAPPSVDNQAGTSAPLCTPAYRIQPGLAAAIALKKSGHNVVVLEKDSGLGGSSGEPDGCARVAANGSKILLDWDLEAMALANATFLPSFWLYKYGPEEAPGSNVLGLHNYEDSLFKEAQMEGRHMVFRHRSLLRILYEKLQPQDNTKAGGDADCGPHVSVLFGAEVVNVDCAACAVTLRSGEVHTADAIIGADGERGIVRRVLMDEENAGPDSATGLALYSAIVPKALVVQNGIADMFEDGNLSSIWAGPNRGNRNGVMEGEAEDVNICLYTPDSSQDGTWKDETEMTITDVLGSCDARIRQLAGLAGPATCVQIKKPYELESWVSSSGRVLALGQAAHPFAPAAFHCYSAALEDGAFIGRIFSHTRDHARVPEFFHAFQEHREPRCARMNGADNVYIQLMTMPDGVMQEGRDAGLRANHAAGRSVLDGDLQDVQDEFIFVCVEVAAASIRSN
ncbi:hypothetical protein GGX14DRAFT_700658 [Mycena pura]|uniref:FAD/NAD(P)-binding domain-containing protein n=1 Tax=Mycena pura TaxID=153505 RepID=A0AAD6UZ86_9AGAR|nr:hypothetical protein GGX14DRAFT_700658 [Mycena pura]